MGLWCSKALSTLATIVAEFGDCRRFAEIGDYSLPDGQAIKGRRGMADDQYVML